MSAGGSARAEGSRRAWTRVWLLGRSSVVAVRVLRSMVFEPCESNVDAEAGWVVKVETSRMKIEGRFILVLEVVVGV